MSKIVEAMLSSIIRKRTCGLSDGTTITINGKDAQKKRQCLNDGRNYNIAVKRPDVIAWYQSEMGFVDRHNRFRHEMLGLHEIWKTKRW